MKTVEDKNGLFKVLGVVLKFFPVLALIFIVSFLGFLSSGFHEYVHLFLVLTSLTSGSLIVILWGYVTTKVVFSIISKERFFLRLIAWPIVGGILVLIFYLAYVAILLLLDAVFDSIGRSF